MPLLRPDSSSAPRPASPDALRPMPRHPEPAAIREALAGLLDKSVSVSMLERRPAEESESGAADRALVATYDGADGPEVISFADRSFVAGAGAALALIPPGQAEEWLSSGTLPVDALDNAAEVLNVLAATLNDVNPARHVKMTGRWSDGDDGRPPEPEAVLGRPRRTAAYAVTIDGYPGGCLHLASR